MNTSILITSLLLTIQWIWAATPSGKTYKDYVEYRDSFTDSQGRTAEYAFSIPTGHKTDSAAAVLIYLHGNNQMSQSEIIDMFMNKANSLGDKYHTFIPVVMTSPDTRIDGITRQWDYDLDPTFVREMIEGNFENQLKVDLSKVYFYGASQGSCFLHAVMMQKMEGLGGGVFAACGCNDYRDPYWEPSQDLVNNFRMYLQSSAGDFLNESAHEAFEFYKYSTKLETLADLDRTGLHCDINSEVEDLAIKFITRVDPYLPSINPPHLKRIKVVSEDFKITSMISEKETNDLLYAQSKRDTSKIFNSKTQGVDFNFKKNLLDSIVELENENNNITAQGLNKKFTDIGQNSNFESSNYSNIQSIKVDFGEVGFVKLENESELRFVNSTKNELLYKRFPDHLFDHNNFKNPDSSLASVAYAGEVLSINGIWQYVLLRLNSDKTLDTLSLDSMYNDFKVSSNKNNLVLLGGLPGWKISLIYSTNKGETWQKLNLPSELSVFYSNYEIFLNSKNEIILSGMNRFYKSNDLGQNWESMANSSYLNLNGFVEDRDNILYAYSDRAIYRFDFWSSENVPSHTSNDMVGSINLEPEHSLQDWIINKDFKYYIIHNTLKINGSGLFEVSIVDAKGKSQTIIKRNLKSNELFIELPPQSHFIKSFIQIKHNFKNKVSITY